jgi:hypothetical protein
MLAGIMVVTRSMKPKILLIYVANPEYGVAKDQRLSMKSKYLFFMILHFDPIFFKIYSVPCPHRGHSKFT